MIHSSIDIFQPRLLPNSEQKVDEMHVSPATANANVERSLFFLVKIFNLKSIIEYLTLH